MRWIVGCLVLGASLVAAACAGGDGELQPVDAASTTAAEVPPGAAVPTSTSVPTGPTSSPSTAHPSAPPSTASSTAPVTAPPSGLRWDGVCTPSDAVASPPAVPTDDLSRFGPLGASPALQIDVPRLVGGASGASSSPRVTTAVVDGAVILAAAGGSSGPVDPSIVAAVTFDGTVRWVRCVPGEATIPFGQAAVRDGQVVIEVRTPDDDRWALLDPDDGELRGDLDPGVYGPGRGDPDPTSLPVSFVPQDQLTGRGPGGEERWRRPDLTSTGLEGGSIWIDGDVAVLQACTTPRVEGRCELALLGIDVATGAARWTLPGWRFVPAGAADGYALVSSDRTGPTSTGPAWTLVDDRTGEPIPGQAWDDAAFQTACCGDSEHFHVDRTGGVVVVVAETRVSVWLPAVHDAVPRLVSVP